MTNTNELPDIRALWREKQLEEIERRLDHLLFRIRSMDPRTASPKGQRDEKEDPQM